MLGIANNPIEIVIQCLEENYKEVSQRIRRIIVAELDLGRAYDVIYHYDNTITLTVNKLDENGYESNIYLIAKVLTNAFAFLISNSPDPNDEEYDEAYNLFFDYYDLKIKELNNNITQENKEQDDYDREHATSLES